MSPATTSAVSAAAGGVPWPSGPPSASRGWAFPSSDLCPYGQAGGFEPRDRDFFWFYEDLLPWSSSIVSDACSRWSKKASPTPRDEPPYRIRDALRARAPLPAAAGGVPACAAAATAPCAARPGLPRDAQRRDAGSVVSRRFRRRACRREPRPPAGGPGGLLPHAGGSQDPAGGAPDGNAGPRHRELGHLGPHDARLPEPEGARVQRATGWPHARSLRARAG